MTINRLLIDGVEIERSSFLSSSPFYSDYTFQTARAGMLDAAQAIGCARASQPAPLAARLDFLRRAADAFSYSIERLEHTVRMTGMPLSQVESYYRQIPEILRDLPGSMQARGKRVGLRQAYEMESLGAQRYKMLVPPDGFCYAVTPGSDPRAAALAAANLGYLGIPFVLRASPRDAAALLTVAALLQGGFDANFASLLFFDPDSTESAQMHFKLVEAASIVWTFGPSQAVDRALRYRPLEPKPEIDLEGLPAEPGALQEALAGLEREALADRLRIVQRSADLFEGKIVLRHESGDCAAIAWGGPDEKMQSILFDSLGYPIVCTALKSVMALDSEDWEEQAAAFLAELKIGDPLDPLTQVGYIGPHHLDSLQALLEANRGRITVYGGERRSAMQAAPLLVASQEDVPDFFGQEIPAYVLAVRRCESLDEAVERLNACVGGRRRLAVSLLGAPHEHRLPAFLKLAAHAVMVDRPTSALAPALHEGNDYLQLLTNARLIAA